MNLFSVPKNTISGAEASKVNVFGKFIGDAAALKTIKDGDEIIARVEGALYGMNQAPSDGMIVSQLHLSNMDSEDVSMKRMFLFILLYTLLLLFMLMIFSLVENLRKIF